MRPWLVAYRLTHRVTAAQRARLTVFSLLLLAGVLLAAGCSPSRPTAPTPIALVATQAPSATATPAPTDPPATATSVPTRTGTPSWVPTSTTTAILVPTATLTPSATPTAVEPLSIEHERQMSYPGSEITIEQTLEPGAQLQPLRRLVPVGRAQDLRPADGARPGKAGDRLAGDHLQPRLYPAGAIPHHRALRGLRRRPRAQPATSSSSPTTAATAVSEGTAEGGYGIAGLHRRRAERGGLAARPTRTPTRTASGCGAIRWAGR